MPRPPYYRTFLFLADVTQIFSSMFPSINLCDIYGEYLCYICEKISSSVFPSIECTPANLPEAILPPTPLPPSQTPQKAGVGSRPYFLVPGETEHLQTI